MAQTALSGNRQLRPRPLLTDVYFGHVIRLKWTRGIVYSPTGVFAHVGYTHAISADSAAGSNGGG